MLHQILIFNHQYLMGSYHRSKLHYDGQLYTFKLFTREFLYHCSNKLLKQSLPTSCYKHASLGIVQNHLTIKSHADYRNSMHILYVITTQSKHCVLTTKQENKTQYGQGILESRCNIDLFPFINCTVSNNILLHNIFNYIFTRVCYVRLERSIISRIEFQVCKQFIYYFQKF